MMRRRLFFALLALSPPVFAHAQCAPSIFVEGQVLHASDLNLGFAACDAFGAATTAQAASLQKAANLSDIPSPPSARTNLGLGGAALLTVGTAAGTVAAGNDSRIAGALQSFNALSELTAAAGSARTNIAAAASGANNDITALNALAAKASWTPTVTFGTPGDLSVVYSTQTGYYYRIGKLIYVYASLVFTPTFTTATGGFRINGLPTTADASVTGGLTAQAFYPAAWPGSTGTMVSASVAVNTNYLQIMGAKSGAAPTAAVVGQFTSGTAYTITVSGFYLSAT